MAKVKRVCPFWIDELTFQAFLQATDIPSTHRGLMFLLLSGGKPLNLQNDPWPADLRWEEKFCVIKANIFGFTHSEGALYEGAYFLENVTASLYTGREALAKEVVPFLPDQVPLSQQHVVYVTRKKSPGFERFVSPLILSLSSSRSAETWTRQISAASLQACRAKLSGLQQEAQKQRSVAQRDHQLIKLRDLQHKQVAEETHLMKKEFLLEIQRLQERARRLQATGEVTEKAAAEYIDQKLNEISALQGHVATGLHEQTLLSHSLSELKEHASKQQCRIRTLELEKRQVESRYNNLLCDLEEAKENPSRLALMMSRFRGTMQRLGTENSKMREENIAVIRRFHEIEAKFDEKFKFVRKVAEAGDVFDYLRKWLLCSEAKILFYETGYKLEKKDKLELLTQIETFQNELRVAAAVARSSYISLRAMLLGEQLKSYTRRAPTPTVCTFVGTALKRFGWVFGEMDLAKSVEKRKESSCPESPSSEKDALVAPFSEQWYHVGGLEGSARFALTKGVDVMKPVENLVPTSRITTLQNEFTLLSIRHRELQDNYSNALDILSEYRAELRRFREQESMRLLAESLKALPPPLKVKAHVRPKEASCVIAQDLKEK